MATPVATSTQNTGNPDQPEVVAVVIDRLRSRLGVASAEIGLVSAEQEQWPDGCLGAAEPGEMCTQAIVEGYRVILEAGGQKYEFHTNMDGSLVREVSPLGSEGESLNADLVSKARLFLSKELGKKLDEIQVQSLAQVDWPDSCLGASKPGQVCAQVITPGYQIIFGVEGKTFEIRMDMEGGVIRLGEAPEQPLSGTVLTWEKTEDGRCSRLEAGEMFLAGECDGELREVEVALERVQELRDLSSAFASFQSGTNVGAVEFSGQGKLDPTSAEQRSLAEWAWMVFQEAQSGSGEDVGKVISWHREGGIAGFCDELVVYASGWVKVANCRANNQDAPGYYRLNSQQLSQLYQWTDRFGSVEISQDDPPGAADAMTITLTIQGRGSQKPSQANQQEMFLFAQEIYNMQ